MIHQQAYKQKTTMSPITRPNNFSKLRLLSPIVVFILLATLKQHATSLGPINYANLRGDSVLTSSENNYAISSDELKENKNWRIVNVNGQNIDIYFQDDCVYQRRTMSNDEKFLLRQVKNNLLDSMYANRFSSYASSGSSYSSSDASSVTNFGDNQRGSIIRVGNSQSQNNFMITSPRLPNDWATVLIQGDIAAFVYNNGTVEMLPYKCLTTNQVEEINALKIESEERGKMEAMRVSENIQKTMSDLQNVMSHSLSNAFGNSFAGGAWPFNNGQIPQVVY